jgi:peptide/nickel transport system ATP-binding protein
VDGVDLAIYRGQTLALVGESGSGKSTLARTIVGLYPPTAGEVLLDEVPLSRVSRRIRTRRLQMVFQDPAGSLNPRLSVGRSIAEPLIAHRWGSSRQIQARVSQLLDQVGLDPRAGRRFPHEFSGGQKQRVGIARAIALEPDLVIADEPTSALDVSIRVQILNLLAEIQARTGMSFLLVSHDLAVVRHYSQHVAVMLEGKIVEMGPTAEILTAPRHPYTRRLLDAIPSPSFTTQPPSQG